LKISENKFLRILDTFQADELAEFRKFVSSPFVASGRNYLPILNEIIRQKSLKRNEISLEELHKKLYPGKRFSAQTLKNRFSELFRIAEEYLIHKSIENNVIEREKILLNALIERNLHKFFESTYKKVLAKFEDIPDDDRKFIDFVEIQRIYLGHLMMTNKFELYFPEYYENSIYQTCLSFISLFEFGMEFRQQDYLNRKYDFNIVPEILKRINFEEFARNSSYKNSPVFRLTLMYNHLYKCYENLENENDYFEARKIFKELKPKLSDDIKLKILMMSIFYCTHKQNQGIRKYRVELLNLYKEKLEEGFTQDFSNPTYPLNNFRDHVLIGIELNELDWVKYFIEEYSKYLPDSTRDDEIRISRSKIDMHTSDFQKSLEHLKDIKPSNFIHYLDVSTLKLCNYYELGLYEESYSEIDKFKHYIRNHKEMPKVHKTYASNFLKIYSMLLKAKTNPKYGDAELIRIQIKSTGFMNKAGWAMKKLLELKE
jgi:hypothetical protein